MILIRWQRICLFIHINLFNIRFLPILLPTLYSNLQSVMKTKNIYYVSIMPTASSSLITSLVPSWLVSNSFFSDSSILWYPSLLFINSWSHHNQISKGFSLHSMLMFFNRFCISSSPLSLLYLLHEQADNLTTKKA